MPLSLSSLAVYYYALLTIRSASDFHTRGPLLMRIRVPKIDRLLYSYPEDDLTHLNWTPASKLKLSRNSETPCIIGQGSPQLSHLESTDHKPSTYHPLQCTLTNRRMTRTHARTHRPFRWLVSEVRRVTGVAFRRGQGLPD